MSNPLYDALFASLAVRDTAFLILADGHEISGTAFHADIARIANALRGLGVQPGDRVAVQIAKSPQALAVYAATKFGVRGLIEALDIEWAPHGVKVRSLMPSFIDTGILAGPANKKSNVSKRDSVMREAVLDAPPALRAVAGVEPGAIPPARALRVLGAARACSMRTPLRLRCDARVLITFPVEIPASFKAADEGIITAETFEDQNVIRGLYRLKAYSDAYLYVARPVGTGIISQLRDAEGALVALREAANNRERIKGAFLLTYIETALLVLVGLVVDGGAKVRECAVDVQKQSKPQQWQCE